MSGAVTASRGTSRNWSDELTAATRDHRNLSYLLGEHGGDGTPHSDPLVYGALCRALDHASARAIEAAEAIAGLAPKVPRKLSLEERRARVADVFREGARWALSRASMGADITHAEVDSSARAFSEGRVSK